MWTDLSSIAQKAKEAAALIEKQINDSLLGEGGGSKSSPSSPAAAGAGARTDDAGSDLSSDGNGRAEGSSEGWEKCDDISSDGSGGEKIKKPDKKENTPQEMSFVDLKAVAKEIPKNNDGEPSKALLDALARMESLEKQVNSLKDELAVAREESQNYHATNLLLEQQIKELQEENKSLKKSGAIDTVSLQK
eukprot:182622_1